MTAKLSIETFPNKAAADYIRGKAVADPKNFGALPNQLKQRAFAVAGIEQLDAVKKIRDTVAKLPEGANWDEVKKEIAEDISTYTGVDMKAARARAEHTLRIQGFQAYAVARHQQQMETADIFPYWKYVTVGDNRVRPGHAALDGKVLKASDPWWNTHYPPWDWGCRCIVESLDEEDAQAIGISKSGDMPWPEHSDSYSFNPSYAGITIDQIAASNDDAYMRLFSAKARQGTVQADGREPETMWELMVDEKVKKENGYLTAETAREGKEHAIVIDFDTGKQIGKVFVGNADSVKLTIPAGKNVATLHTHTNGDNTPSPTDILDGFRLHSKAEYVAAGKKLRRWVWLKTPTPEDADLIQMYKDSVKAGDFNSYAWESFLERLANEGYIKMEVLS